MKVKVTFISSKCGEVELYFKSWKEFNDWMISHNVFNEYGEIKEIKTAEVLR